MLVFLPSNFDLIIINLLIFPRESSKRETAEHAGFSDILTSSSKIAEAKVPDRLNRKQAYDCLVISLLIRLRMLNLYTVQCIPPHTPLLYI